MSIFAALEVAVDETRRLIIQHPHRPEPLRNAETGEPAWIDLLPADSDVAKRHQRALTDRSIKAGQKRLKAEDFEVANTELYAKLTKGWSLVGLDGAPLDVPVSERNARELYSMPSLAWLRRQVEEFVNDLGNWTVSSSKS